LVSAWEATGPSPGQPPTSSARAWPSSTGTKSHFWNF
jgi:hypothetical protein